MSATTLAVVEQISYEDAETIILKYEWLQTMPRITRACYGLRIGDELLGVAIFGMSTSSEAHAICGQDYAAQSICLARGACVPHAPANAASFLIRHACKQACREFGWQVFFAYSDPDAGEVGTVYQAVGWKYIGNGNGRVAESFHVDWKSPDGTRTITSNKLNHDREKKFFRSLGWTELKGDPRAYIQHLGWKPIRRPGKGRYIWFEGTRTEKAELAARCRYQFLSYPKRGNVATRTDDAGAGTQLLAIY